MDPVRIEEALRRKYPDDALERLVQAYSTHGDYLPELARLLLIERAALREAQADYERLREALTRHRKLCPGVVEFMDGRVEKCAACAALAPADEAKP